MNFILIANSRYQEVGTPAIGWFSKNPLSNCHRNPEFIDLFISYFKECNELMKNPKEFLSDIGAEKWENRSHHLVPVCKQLFGETFKSEDIDDVTIFKVPDGYEYKIIMARNGNEELIVWDPQDPGRTLKFAQEVDLDTL